MSSKQILRITNLYSYNCNITFFSFRIMSKSVSLKFLRLKLVKLECIIMQFDLYTIKDLAMSWMEPVACILFIIKTEQGILARNVIKI